MFLTYSAAHAIFSSLHLASLSNKTSFQQTFSGYQLCKHIQQINSEGQFIWVETPFQQLEQVAFVQYKMNKSYKADIYTMGLQKVSHQVSCFCFRSLSGIKKSCQKKKKRRERETSGLNSTTSYLIVTGPSLTTQNFCITEALLDAANSVNPSA